MNPRVRANRILSGMKRFKFADREDLKILFENNNLIIKEGDIGFYENSENSIEEGVIVSDSGLTILSSSKEKNFSYNEIDVILPLDNKETTKEIVVILNSCEKVLIPVYGKDGRFRDIFEFSRFLNRVFEDYKKSVLSE